MEPEGVQAGVAEDDLHGGTGSGIFGENRMDIFSEVIKGH
jgi:hypothetical protein